MASDFPPAAQDLVKHIRAGNVSGVKGVLRVHAAMCNSVSTRGWTVLHEAAAAGLRQPIADLIEAGAKLDAADESGITPCHVAALVPEPEPLALLLFSGADAEVKDKTGMTPLHWAAAAGRLAAVEELLRHRAEVDARDVLERAPAHYAALHESSSCLKALLDAGADAAALSHEQDEDFMYEINIYIPMKIIRFNFLF